jgi:hypothetical protein
MSNEHIIPAQPGFRAWAISEGNHGKRHAFFCGDVLAWHMVPTIESNDDEPTFAAKPVTVYGGYDVMVIRDGDGSMFDEGSATSFKAWLRSEGLILSGADADLASRLYGVSDDLIENGGCDAR